MVGHGHHVQVSSGLTVDILETNVTGHTFASEEEVNLDNLYPALVQCFGIIFLGFAAGKFSFISDVEATRFHHRQLGELSKKLLRLGLAFHCLLLLSICSIVVFKRSCLNRPYIII